ncbi:serine hydrolase domain-containing protein [Allorhizocola rhizosphaerae]|uniref:serine hydrolase domain-containing protein n=1 Tax=Allorhizocola rhizosphaerae TaxID=1872709 RepID=UPI001FE4C2AC|nr:serine hydrolase domain-containing protein [Allorhizocola rhizosphaerae]
MTAVTLVLFAPATPAVAAGSGELQSGLDRITAAGMPGVMAETRVHGGRQSAASGVADVDSGRGMSPTFSHRAGSITKTFTATVILQLVGEGRIDLDAPVSRYLPQYDTAGITVRMLLNHTSGISDYDHLIFTVPDDLLRHRTTTFTADQLARIGLDAPRTSPPGGPHLYANTNYILAGLVIEKVTGRPAAFEMYRRIIVPLGLWRTYFAGASSHIAGPHSHAYIPWLDGTMLDFSVYNMSFVGTAGDVVSTTRDLNVFFKALLTGRLLRPAQLAEMKTVVPWNPNNPGAGGYGLGLYSVRLPCGVMIWGHDGLVFGHSAISMHTESADRQITIGSNMTHYADPTQPEPIGLATGELLFRTLCQDSLRAAGPPFAWKSPIHTGKAQSAVGYFADARAAGRG